jgi:hypothetical protein
MTSDMVHIGSIFLNAWPNAPCARLARTKSLKSKTREEREGRRLEANAAWI